MKNFDTETDPIMKASFTPRRQSAELLVCDWADDVNKKAKNVIVLMSAVIVLAASTLIFA